MTYPLVRELAAEGVPVAVTCRVLKFSKQGYFKWLQAPCSRRDYENAYLTNAILDVHRDDPAFGYRFIADELERKGLSASENRVWECQVNLAPPCASDLAPPLLGANRILMT